MDICRVSSFWMFCILSNTKRRALVNKWVRDKYLLSSCCDCYELDKLLVSYIKEKMNSRVNLPSIKFKEHGKNRIGFFIGLLFCMQAFADTYYCTQTAKVLIEPNNKVKKYYKFDDIYKLTIHKKENTMLFASLEDLNATKDVSQFTISLINQSDDQIFARFQTKELLTDMKINFYPGASVDSKLVRTISNETYTFVEYFQCTKEEKY